MSEALARLFDAMTFGWLRARGWRVDSETKALPDDGSACACAPVQVVRKKDQRLTEALR